VFDLETENWDKYVVGGCLTSGANDEPGEYKDFRFEQESDAVDYLFGLWGDVWSHNGGIFDNKWALDHANARGLSCRAIPAGARIVELRIGKNLRLLDSKALTKISLEDLTKGQDVAKEKLELPCVCGEACGGYCSIRRDMPTEHWGRVRDYLKADCYSLFGAMQKVRRFALQANLDLGITVGSAAWACASRWLKLPKADLGKDDHEFARKGYFGGRVHKGKDFSGEGFEADVSSMYPSRLATKPVPIGESTRHIDERNSGLSYAAGLPGIYRVAVKVPETHLPVLPVRGTERVYYPFGEFEGTWTRPELEYAVSQGTKIEAFRQALVWPESKVLFAEWVEAMFALRANAPGGKSGPIGTFLKYILNSLTGKFGARADNETVELNPPELRACYCTLEDLDSGGKCFCGAHAPYGDSPSVFLARRWRLASCAHIEWAGYLTAEARVEWHRQAVSSGDGGRDVVYGDTDSLFTEIRRLRAEGKNLGEWEFKGTYRNLQVVAPKVYWFERGEELNVRGKGLRLGLARSDAPLGERNSKAQRARGRLEPAARGGRSDVFARDGIVGFWRGAKEGKFFVREHTTRAISAGFGGRILDSGAAYTRAPHISEIEERERKAA
jgi:hypothetical protein